MARTTEENKALIAEKEKQIEALRKEIKALRGPAGIASLTKNLLVTARGTYGGGMIPKNGNVPDDWTPIVKLCLRPFYVSRVSDLEDAEMYLAAEMADELILIFNKYHKAAQELRKALSYEKLEEEK